MKNQITNESLCLLEQIEERKIDSMDRSDACDYLREHGWYVSVEYNVTDEYQAWHYRVQNMENMNVWSYGAFGHNSYSKALDAGIEVGLACMLDEKKRKLERIKIEQLQKEGELLSRKQIKQAFEMLFGADMVREKMQQFDEIIDKLGK